MLEIPLADPNIDILFEKMYSQFIEAIDANDNGESAYPDDIAPTFNVSSITLPSLVANLNPSWNEPCDDNAIDVRFHKASKLMGDVFLSKLLYYGKSWLPARGIVADMMNPSQSSKYDSQGRIVVFDQFVPWKEHLFTLEKELGIEGRTVYVVYSDGKGWRVQAVPVDHDSFKSRKALPEPWRGIRDDALSKVTGISGGVFVHASGMFY